ncbi:competence type IV pilus ATPase ComGA [Alkalicoccus chagannorensis]|uniref:competence type IV pilus ATPase ComGA n=1 Tax=Alkalicoccus chagannorensis TaxID=427072 RepID=UPI00041EC8C0|nr:competence type IV pilus ATPase ComGA [Alkalicoccus chagannorensis]
MDVVAKFHQLIKEAVSMQASDLHLLTEADNVRVRLRVDGRLMDMERLTISTGRKLISHMKFSAGMDIGERRRPQNKRLELNIGSRTLYARMSTFPSAMLETVVVRIFPYDTSREMKELALFPSQIDSLQKLILSPHGLVLLCGPTGAGKTTTLYSMLQERLKNSSENIMTLEDPVERKQDGLLQMEINEKAGVTYAAALRSLLRHDPDVIVIGEIRDEETAASAVKAAMSGHLVVSSLHSATAAGALRRMLDLGTDPADLREVLYGIAAQKLVDTACPFCSGACSIHCKKRRTSRRKALYEILMEEELQLCFNQLHDHHRQELPVKNFRHLLQRGVALGFISEGDSSRISRNARL